MSDIKILEQRAMEIKRKYDLLEKQRNRQPKGAVELTRAFKKEISDLLSIVDQDIIDRKKLNRGLADCLWSVLVIARRLDVDIERVFWATMAELEQFEDGKT
jgi:NTP pyrophosphatase (non-canonical NTP hydrolase)